MAQAGKEFYKNNMHHHDTLKTIARAYLSNQESLFQDVAYHILPELNLRRIFLALYFIHTNLPGEKVWVLLSEKELSQLPDNSGNIFKKFNVVYEIKRLSPTLCNAEYSLLNDYYAWFLACNTLEKKWKKTFEYQPDGLDDNLIENNHRECSYPPPHPHPLPHQNK